MRGHQRTPSGVEGRNTPAQPAWNIPTYEVHADIYGHRWKICSIKEGATKEVRPRTHSSEVSAVLRRPVEREIRQAWRGAKENGRNGDEIPRSKLFKRRIEQSARTSALSYLSHHWERPFSRWSIRVSGNTETQGLLSEKQCGFRPRRSATDMMYDVMSAVSRMQALERKARVQLFLFPWPLESVRLRPQSPVAGNHSLGNADSDHSSN